jgi:hypothetical protein
MIREGRRRDLVELSRPYLKEVAEKAFTVALSHPAQMASEFLLSVAAQSTSPPQPSGEGKAGELSGVLQICVLHKWAMDMAARAKKAT